MKTLQLPVSNKKSNKRLIVLFALLLLSSIGVFGQEAKAEKVDGFIAITADQAKAEDNSKLELVSWLTGARQSQLSNETATKTSTNKSGKKQFINSGMTPNRILSRTLLKKAMSCDNAVA